MIDINAELRRIERVPPVNDEAEDALLACCIHDAGVIARVPAVVRPADFSKPWRSDVFAAMLAVCRRGEPVDLITVGDELKRRGLFETHYGYAIDIQASIPTTTHADSYAQIVATHATRRAAIATCYELLDDLYEARSDDPYSRALGAVMGLAPTLGGPRSATHIGEVTEEVFARADRAYQERQAGRIVKPTVTTGLYDLDQMLLIEPGDMIVIGARPSAGKTALVLQIINHIADQVPIYIASLEMSREALVRRMIAARAGVSTTRQRTGYFTPAERERMALAAGEIGMLKVYIDDRPNLTVSQIAAAAQTIQAREGLGCMFVDHMSLVAGEERRMSAYDRMTQVSKDLKGTFRRLRVPGFAIAQLSRGSESEDRKPRMSDLRDSGGVEQDADAIGLLHRPDRKTASGITEAEILLEKQRDGAVGNVPLLFFGETGRFECAATETEATA